MQAHIFGFVMLVTISACGAAANQATPQAGLHAYVRALRAENPHLAYELLTKEQRALVPYKEFAARWKHSRLERQAEARTLERRWQLAPKLHQQAQVSYAAGATATLVKEPQGWRLQAPVRAVWGIASPAIALSRFAEAIRSKNFNDLVQLLSLQLKNDLLGQLSAFEEGLTTELAHELYLVSDRRAEVTWDNGPIRYKIVFVKEGNEWRIHDVYAGPDPTESPEEAAETSQ